MTNLAYILCILCPYIHICYIPIHVHIYLLFNDLQKTLKKIAQLFTNLYKITA